MNTDWMKGNWKQFVGKAKEKWGRLTNDDWKVGTKIQERYGITRDEAERQPMPPVGDCYENRSHAA